MHIYKFMPFVHENERKKKKKQSTMKNKQRFRVYEFVFCWPIVCLAYVYGTGTCRTSKVNVDPHKYINHINNLAVFN